MTTNPDPEDEQKLELREEVLVPHPQPRNAGEIVIRKRVTDAPGRLEVEAYAEDVEVQHEPVGESVTERRDPWDEDGTLVIPVYEEQLIVSKRLVLRERLRIRKLATTQRRLIEDTLRREQVVVEDPQHTGRVREL